MIYTKCPSCGEPLPPDRDQPGDRYRYQCCKNGHLLITPKPQEQAAQ